MDNIDLIVAKYKGTELEKLAKEYYAGDWNEIDSFAKFTWLAYAEREAKKNSDAIQRSAT
jgi:hypothetical protein